MDPDRVLGVVPPHLGQLVCDSAQHEKDPGAPGVVGVAGKRSPGLEIIILLSLRFIFYQNPLTPICSIVISMDEIAQQESHPEGGVEDVVQHDQEEKEIEEAVDDGVPVAAPADDEHTEAASKKAKEV